VEVDTIRDLVVIFACLYSSAVSIRCIRELKKTRIYKGPYRPKIPISEEEQARLTWFQRLYDDAAKGKLKTINENAEEDHRP